jgi:hypothetical protein
MVCIYEFHMILSYYIPKHHLPIGLLNGKVLCFPYRKNLFLNII